MAYPRRSISSKRVNLHWLMNAASLVAAIGAFNISENKDSDLKNTLNKTKLSWGSLVPSAEAVDFFWAGGSNARTTEALWSGSVAKASGTALDYSYYSTSAVGVAPWGNNQSTSAASTSPGYGAFTSVDNLWFGSSTAIAGTTSWSTTAITWSSTINLGSSNTSINSMQFVSGAAAYTFVSPSNNQRTLTLGVSTTNTSTNPCLVNNSSSAITFNNILIPGTGLSATSASIFTQNDPTGSIVINGASGSASSWIINPYAYDWGVSPTGGNLTSSAAAALATGTNAFQAMVLASGSTSNRYIKFTGSGKIIINGSIGDALRNNAGSTTSPFSSGGIGNILITNTSYTYLNGWNTYTGTTTIGDGTASGGVVYVGNPYAFGGNRKYDTTSANWTGTSSGYTGTAYLTGQTGTTASGFSSITQAYGAVTVNTGFSIDLNGTTMIGANGLTINGAGASGTGVIRNTSTNAATYAGLITLGNTSTMSTSFGNITLAGGINTSSKTLTIDGASNTYITGPITGTTSGRIQKVGTGTLTISGSNSSPGILKVVAGKVIVTSPDALSTVGTNSILDSGASSSDTGELVLTGGLANSNAYRMGTITPGGNLNISTLGGNSTLTFDAASGSGQSGTVEKRLSVNAGVNVIITGTFDLIGSTAASDRNFRIDGDGNITFNGVVQNGASGTPLTNGYKGGLNKNSGNGILTLNGANTFNNGVIFGSGYIKVGSAENPGVSGPLGVSGTLTLNGGYLQYSDLNQYDYSSRFSTAASQKYNVDTNGQAVTWQSDLVSVGGVLNKIGSGTLTLSGNNILDSGVNISAGVLQLNSANALGSSGLISFLGGVLQFSSNNTSDYSARFSTAASQAYNINTNGQTVTLATGLTSSGGILTKTGNGTLVLSGPSTYSGDTTISQGEILASDVNVLSQSSSVVVSSGATLNLNSKNQTLKGLAGAGTVSTGTATLTIADGSNLTFTGDITGNGNVIKSGTGTQTFASSLTYTGSTSINAGVLKVNNTLASSTVNIAGSATLEGKGTISGSVVVASGGIITAGDSSLADASRGALTLSALTLNGTAVINIANINAQSSPSILNVGALSALGGAGSITINISNTTQLADNSSFTVLKYTSLDDFTAFTQGTITGTYNRQLKTLVNDSANNQIILTTTGDTLKWTGSSSLTPQWTTSSGNVNWKLSSSGDPAEYLASDIVAFDDTASNFVVTIAEDVSPNGITFNNTTNYTINSTTASSFGIIGQASITKSGTGRVDINAPLKISGGLTVNNGTLALNNSSNTFTGNINLNGTANLELGASGALGTSNSLTFGAGATGKLSLNGNNATLAGLANNSGNIGSPIIENGSSSSNSTLTLNLSSDTTFDGVMQNGSSSSLLLTKTGSGTLTLTANNTLTGLTTVTAGTLQLGSGGTTGSVGGDISIGSSGTLNLSRTDKISLSKILSGSGLINLKTGQLELLAANTFTGTMALSSGTTLTVGSNGSLLSSVTITNNGLFEYNNSLSTASLGAMSGTGTLSVLANTLTQSGTNTITGSLNIAAGSTYVIGSSGSLNNVSSITNNGTFSLSTRAADYTLSVAMGGSGNLVSNLGTNRTLFITGNNTYTGSTAINSGTVNVGNSGSSGLLGSSGVSIASGAELLFTKTTDTTLYGGISGAGKITLSGTGKIILDANSPINIGGELKFGSSAASAVHSVLDLSSASATVGALKVQTDATSNLSSYNSIIIGAGQSLNVVGPAASGPIVSFGTENGSNPTTNLTISGGGTFNVGYSSSSPANADIKVGLSTSGSKINFVNWDMSALSALNIYLGTGTFYIGSDLNPTGGTPPNNPTTGATVKLANNTTISAAALLIDSLEPGKTYILNLGSGLTTLNLDTLSISGTNNRGTSQLYFNDANGSLTVRSKSGGRATLNVQSAANSTGNNISGNLNLLGHYADLLLSTTTVGQRLSLTSSGSGSGSGYLAFDTGTFDATTLNIGNKSHNGTNVSTLSGNTSSSSLSGNIVGLASFGGGNVILGSVNVGLHGASNVGGIAQGLIEFWSNNGSTLAATLGTVTLATSSAPLVSGSVATTGSFNVAGGSVYVSAINGASAASNTAATANVNVSGGALTLGGNIVRTGGLGTSNFNLNLSGGTLDVGGFAIGSSTSAININWTGGTLKNVSGLNGTSGIIVNSGSQFIPVYLDGNNTFNSTITLKDSLLQLVSSTALGANSKVAFDGTLSVLQYGVNAASLDVSNKLTSGNAQVDTNGNNVTFNNSVSGLTSFTKLGYGKLTLGSSSGTLAPSVIIFGGTLEVGSGDNSIPVGGFLNGTTSISLDGSGLSPELNANGVKVDLNADINLLNGGAVISGSKGTSAYSFNFKKDIIIQDNATATLSATDMITGSNSNINVASGAVLTVSGSFIDNTDTQQATQITKNGLGTLEFTGTGNAYSGATTVNAGIVNITQGAFTNAETTITVNNTASLAAVDLGAKVSVTVASGGTAEISGADISLKDIVTQNTNAGAFNFSASTGKITAQSLSGSGSVTFASDLEVDTLNGAGTVVLSASAPTLTVGAGTFSGTLSGTGSLVKKGSGTLTISGTNTFTGSVTLNDGIVSVSDLAALGAASDSPENLILQGGKLKYTGTGTTMTKGFTVGDGISGFVSSGTGALVIQGDMDFADVTAASRTLSLGGTTDIAVENIFNPTQFDGADIANLFNKLVKQETNKWIVLGAGAGFVDDAQTDIDIQNGELGFAMGSLGSKSTITLGSTTQGEMATLGWAGTNTEDVSGRVNLRAASNAAFDIPTGSTVTFASALNGGISNNASVTKTGGGTLVLNETNSFSGGFTISGGTARAAKLGALGSGAVTVNANSTLIVSAVIANTVTIKSGGTLTSDQANQQIDDTTVEEDGLLLPGGNIIGTMTAHNLTLKGGSIVDWQISNAAGAVDADYSQAGIGYDTFILNSLALTDASLKRVHINVKNIFGEKASNFDKGNVQTFKFAKLTNKLSLTDASHVTDLFEIDASEFEYIGGLKTDHLVWQMTVSADREYLYVIAIPEPSTYGLGLGALAIAAAAVRRRKQKIKSAAV